MTETVLRNLRSNLGLEETDMSRDEEIKRRSPLANLRALCRWELGDAYWADQFIEWAEVCGMEIKNKG